MTRAQRGLARPLFWGPPGLLALLALALVSGCRGEPPLLGQVPAFTLVRQDHTPFGSEALRGRAYVASFVFTSCASVCPKLMARMRTIQERTRHHGDALQLLSISVDPENDTPDKLRAFGAGYDAGSRWHLLTGDPKVVEALVVRGFRLSMDRVADDAMQVAHSERFVLVDRGGRVRGYYLAEGEGLEALLRDVESLVR